ncbi:MAG: Ldh family oxidoreductase [Planctomycetaceae bacterium]
MPTFHADQLHTLATRILKAAGVREPDAEIVATELKDANLVGHDSHGVMRLMQYIDQINQGFIQTDGEFEIVHEKPGFAQTDGHFQFGQVSATKALEIGMTKAREQGVSTVTIRNCNHVGRLGSYSQKAAMNGFASMMCVNAPGPGGVAPFGGIDRKLGTNPISMSAPRGDAPFVLDMTSSATAEGKVRVALQKGETLPDGWIIDSEGNPSNHPADLYGPPEGAILPLGGAMGFKGFGLSVMIDVFGGILSQSGVCRTDLPRGANGVWMYFLDVAQFIGEEDYGTLMERYVEHIKSARKTPGTEEIFLPGEIELRRQASRTEQGIPIPDETWRQLKELAANLGTSLDDLSPISC